MNHYRRWITVFRLHTLSASYIPVTFGTLYAYYQKAVFDLPLFFAMLFASVLIQMSTNLFNDYFDYQRGIDQADSVGKSTALVTGEIKPNTIMILALTFIAFSGLLGLFIVSQAGLVIALIGAASILVGFFYSAGPHPISATAFGELFAGFFMGHVIIGISYFIQTDHYDMAIFLVSIPFALLIASLLTANNIRDLDEDTQGGRKTLAILLGKEKAILFLKITAWIAYLLIPLFVYLSFLPVYALIVFISAAKINKAALIFTKNHTPQTMAPAMGQIAKNNVHFGLLMILSLIAAILF